MSEPGPKRMTGAWWRYPLAFLLLLAAFPLWALAALLGGANTAVTTAGDRLTDLIDRLTGN